MKMKLIKISFLFLFLFVCTDSLAGNNGSCPKTLDFTMKTLVGNKQVNLCKEYLGKVVLVVNTASKCGYTYQYEGLEKLYARYKSRGLVVVGFPSNDFGAQEPGNEKQIASFCRLTYGVKFPMFEKTHARKQDAAPLYKTLGTIAGEFPAWNFHKYILDRQGNLVASFKSKVEPESATVINVIEKLL